MPANDVTIKGGFTAANVNYTVKHYKQSVDGTYPSNPTETETKTGKTGATTQAEAKTYEGFTAQAFNQKTIAADGTTVVEIYYARKPFTLTINYAYEKDGTEAAETYVETLSYGATYSIPSPPIPGYTADVEVVSGTMPENNVIVNVVYSKNPIIVTRKAKTETTTITNSNIVVVIDTSKSMSSTMMSAAKTVTKDLIDKVSLSDDVNNVKSTISVIQFNSTSTLLGTAKTNADVAELKNRVDNMTQTSGTYMANALNTATTTLSAISNENTNKNIIIFLSDGRANPNTGVPDAAKSAQAIATVYSIGFGSNADTDTLQNIIATDTGKYYPASANLTSLTNVFTTISNDISNDTTTVSSVNGRVELPNIDMEKEIVFTVNGSNTAYNISYENGMYYLDVSNYLSTDTVLIEYYTK